MYLIKPLEEKHWNDVKEIYLDGIATGQATFQTTAPNWDEWNQGHLQVGRLVALDNNTVVGWVALSPVSSRCVYAGVSEVSIYIASNYRGKGIGSLLFDELISESENNGIHTLQSSLFPENLASKQLHLKHGFRLVGTREKIGKMGDMWRDTIILERRSKKTGL